MPQFSAVDPSLGYLYQVRSALLWALRRIKVDPGFLVGIETLDDVTFETTGGDPTDLLQTKHHRTGTSSHRPLIALRTRHQASCREIPRRSASPLTLTLFSSYRMASTVSRFGVRPEQHPVARGG